MTANFADSPLTQHQLARQAHMQISAVVTDLGRLEGVVDHAAEELLASFTDFRLFMDDLNPAWVDTPAFGAMNRAVTAIQFHDIAVKLVSAAKQQLNETACGLDVEHVSPDALKIATNRPINDYTPAHSAVLPCGGLPRQWHPALGSVGDSSGPL